MSLVEVAFDRVFDAQQTYRIVLDALARPGLVKPLDTPSLTPPPGMKRTAAAFALALFDSNVSWHGDPAWESYIVANTSAPRVSVNAAQFVFLNGDAMLEDVSTGTLQYPDTGATLLVQVDALATDGMAITLSGPGIETTHSFRVQGLSTVLLAAIAEANSEFPLGVDTLLCSDAAIVGIPRSSQIRWSV